MSTTPVRGAAQQVSYREADSDGNNSDEEVGVFRRTECWQKLILFYLPLQVEPVRRKTRSKASPSQVIDEIDEEEELDFEKEEQPSAKKARVDSRKTRQTDIKSLFAKSKTATLDPFAVKVYPKNKGVVRSKGRNARKGPARRSRQTDDYDKEDVEDRPTRSLRNRSQSQLSYR